MKYRKGLWFNIRKNRGSGKKPTADMLKQEKKIKSETGEGKKYPGGKGKKYFNGLGLLTDSLSKIGGGGLGSVAKGALSLGTEATGLMGALGNEKASKVSNSLNNINSTVGTVAGAFEERKEKKEIEEKNNMYFSGKSNLKAKDMDYGKMKMFPGGKKGKRKEKRDLKKLSKKMTKAEKEAQEEMMTKGELQFKKDMDKLKSKEKAGKSTKRIDSKMSNKNYNLPGDENDEGDGKFDEFSNGRKYPGGKNGKKVTIKKLNMKEYR